MTVVREDEQSVESLLRRGLISFTGGATAGLAGLVLALLVGRTLGTAGSGVFFAVVAVVMIASNICKMGADTGMVWILPRFRSHDRPQDQKTAVAVAVVPVAVVSAVVAAGLWLGAEPLAGLVADGQDVGQVTQGLKISAIAVLLGTLATMAVAATRGYGLLVPFVAIQNIGIPLARVLAVGAAVVAGGGVLAALGAWTAAWVVGGGIALGMLLKVAQRHHAATEGPSAPWRTVGRELWSFSLPRAFAQAVEIALVWVDVLLVAALLGPAEAGVYAILSRFVTAGALGDTALRLTLAPRFSKAFAEGDRDSAKGLLQSGVPLMISLSWPVFIVTALIPATVLGIFGAGFESGALALTLLSISMLLAALLGPVQSALLMSGHTRIQLLNKVIALAVLVGADLYLIPIYGVTGAALGWSAALLVDSCLAAAQLWRLERIHGWSRRVPQAMIIIGGGCAIVVVLAVLAGLTGWALLIASGLGSALVVGAALVAPLSPLSLRKGGMAWH